MGAVAGVPRANERTHDVHQSILLSGHVKAFADLLVEFPTLRLLFAEYIVNGQWKSEYLTLATYKQETCQRCERNSTTGKFIIKPTLYELPSGELYPTPENQHVLHSRFEQQLQRSLSFFSFRKRKKKGSSKERTIVTGEDITLLLAAGLVKSFLSTTDYYKWHCSTLQSLQHEDEEEQKHHPGLLGAAAPLRRLRSMIRKSADLSFIRSLFELGHHVAQQGGSGKESSQHTSQQSSLHTRPNSAHFASRAAHQQGVEDDTVELSLHFQPRVRAKDAPLCRESSVPFMQSTAGNKVSVYVSTDDEDLKEEHDGQALTPKAGRKDSLSEATTDVAEEVQPGVQLVEEQIDHYVELLGTTQEALHVDALEQAFRSLGWLQEVLRYVDELPFAVSIADARRNAHPTSAHHLPHSQHHLLHQRTTFPLLYVNRAFEELTQLCAQEVLGQNCRVLQSEEHTEHVQIDRMVDALRDGRPVKVCVRNVRKDGSAFFNLLALRPVHVLVSPQTPDPANPDTHSLLHFLPHLHLPHFLHAHDHHAEPHAHTDPQTHPDSQTGSQKNSGSQKNPGSQTQSQTHSRNHSLVAQEEPHLHSHSQIVGLRHSLDLAAPQSVTPPPETEEAPAAASDTPVPAHMPVAETELEYRYVLAVAYDPKKPRDSVLDDLEAIDCLLRLLPRLLV